MNNRFADIVHSYFGWKGTYFSSYGFFVAVLDPNGVPCDKMIRVPDQLVQFVKEL